MESPIDSLQAAAMEKLRSGPVGTFVLSWCASNWRIWPYTFEHTPARVKVERIEAQIGLMSGVVLPVVATLVILLAVPWFKAWVAARVARPRLAELKSEAEVRDAEAATNRDRLRKERLEAQAERREVDNAIEDLRQQQRDWEAGEGQRAVAKQHGEEELKRLTAEIEGLRLKAEEAEVARGIAQAQLEDLKAARSEALTERDALRTQATQLGTRVKIARQAMELLLAGGPHDPELLRTLWAQVQSAINGLAPEHATPDREIA